MTEIDESMIMDPELSDYQMTDKPNENASSHQNSLLIQPASADCCAYLCTFCPCTSFASMELLERHICEEHHPTKQHNDNSNNICELDEMEEKPIKTSATEDMASSQQQNGSSAFHVEFGSPLTTSTVAPHSPADSSVASSFSTSTAAEAGSLGEQNKLLLLADLLTCKKCPGGRTFDSRDLLDQHCASTHRDRPQYACSQCGAVFSIKRELATHSRIHSGEQPHQCEKCGKEFGTRQLLKKHNMWHVGERSHVCPHCGKAFFQKGHLTQHLMIHKGGRPHKCNLCEKTFIFKFDLNRHVKIHSERNFLCKRCSKCFQLESELAEHAPKCKGTPASVAGQQQAQQQPKESRRGGKSSRQKSKQSSSVNCSPMSGAGSSPSSLLANAAGNWAAEEIKEEPKFEEMDTSAEQQELFPSVQSQESGQTQVSPTGLLCCPGTDDEEGLANFAFSAAIESLNNQRNNNNSQQLSVGHLAASLLASQRQNVGIGAAGFQQQNGQRQQQQQQQFPCLLCPQKFPNQTAYLFHWGLAHMRDCAVGPAANAAFHQQMEEQRSFAHNLFQQKLLAGLGDPLLHLNAPIGTSCASSPQKVSPSSSSTSSSSSAATTECHLLNLPLGQSPSLLEHFPGLAGLRQPAHFPAGCSNCPLERQRLAEKERELADTRAQLDRIRGLFLHLDSMLAAGGGNGTSSLSAAGNMISHQAIPPSFGGNGIFHQLFLGQPRAPN